MKLRVLGASGSSSPGHKLTAFLLNDTLLLDAGSVTNVLSLEAQKKIKHIFISHAHLDHIRDIPFLLDNLFLKGVKTKIFLYSIPEVVKQIKKNLFNSEVWPDFSIIPSPEKAILKFKVLNFGQSVSLDSLNLLSLPSKHTVPSVAYLVSEEEKRILYTGDTTYDPEIWKVYASTKPQILITEVSFPNHMEELAYLTGHLTPKLLQEGLKHFHLKPNLVLVYHLKTLYTKKIIQELYSLNEVSIKPLKEGEVLTF